MIAKSKTASKPTGTRYASVREMMEKTGVSKRIIRDVKRLVAASELTTALTVWRLVHRFTATKLAKRLGITKDQLLAIECGFDADLTKQQLLAYTKVLVKVSLAQANFHPGVRLTI